jgi:RHS repeat-associated protein
VASATYDAANRQLSFGDKTMTFDENGNLTSMTDPSGISNFSWDARNRLTALSGPMVNALFVYDVFGRRRERTINVQRIQFLYDGKNPVQEVSGVTVLANTLTGLGTDEFFSRADSSGTQHLLSDGLRSTVALSDFSGAVQTEYTYEPFGHTAVYGGPTSNPLQYTGRENDGTGLYYYRARYYAPTLQRFVAEDPIGFGGWDFNIYAYVANNPINFSDPLGLFQWYGNWGGPDYTGGQLGSWNTIDRSRARPPIDRQDECYKVHDLCYGACRDNYSCNCPADRQACFRKCDRQLSTCLNNLQGHPSHNLSAIAGGWLFAIREPGAECER